MRQRFKKIRQSLSLTVRKFPDLHQQSVLLPDITFRYRKKLLEADLQRIAYHLQILNRNSRFSEFLSLSRSGQRSYRRPMRRYFTATPTPANKNGIRITWRKQISSMASYYYNPVNLRYLYTDLN